MCESELLLYRSNLLGSDLTVTNFGGGNTSAKIMQTDPLTGESVEVLWVKGSGGDIGSMKLDGFSTLYQAKLLALVNHYAGPDDDDKMVGFLPHCTFNLNSRAASIDTPLHSLLPSRISTMSTPMRSSRWPHRAKARRRRARSGATRSAGCRGSAPALRWG